MLRRIIRRGVSLVKSLHAIGEITAHSALNEKRLVQLVRSTRTSVDDLHVSDPARATVEALAAPLGHPPLSAAIVPGDRVAIAVDESVPCVGEVVRGVVIVLRDAGVDSESISIVTRDGQTSQLCRDALAEKGDVSAQFVVHDPDDERDLCMVGMTKRHGPLVINRAIFDADVIVPVGCGRLESRGVFGSLFPRFSNSEAIQRFCMPSRRDSAAALAKLVRETDEAGWLIGAIMVVEVVPAANESVSQVVAGEPMAVAEKVGRLGREQWELRSLGRASLVIATLTGGAQSQTWENVGRALTNAERLVAEDGAIAICTNLDQPPGKSLGRLIRSAALDTAELRIYRDHASDSWPAWQLARALQRGPVYFLSQLDADTVEDLGMAPVADVAELLRLAGRHESVLVLPDAQHALASVDGEENES